MTKRTHQLGTTLHPFNNTHLRAAGVEQDTGVLFCESNVGGDFSTAEADFDEVVAHLIGVISGVIFVPPPKLAVLVGSCNHIQNTGRARDTRKQTQKAAGGAVAAFQYVMSYIKK